jgi:hypothetical protein
MQRTSKKDRHTKRCAKPSISHASNCPRAQIGLRIRTPSSWPFIAFCLGKNDARQRRRGLLAAHGGKHAFPTASRRLSFCGRWPDRSAAVSPDLRRDHSWSSGHPSSTEAKCKGDRDAGFNEAGTDQCRKSGLDGRRYHRLAGTGTRARLPAGVSCANRIQRQAKSGRVGPSRDA